MLIKDYLVTFSRKVFVLASRPLLNQLIAELRMEVLAAQSLAPLSTPYFPWTRPALSPHSVITILNDILLNHRAVIVECGGGVSTIFIARLLQQNAHLGHLYTIEHDERWVKFLEETLRKENLEDHVTLVHAPLCPNKYSLDNSDWYDEKVIEATFSEVKVDLLIVDGPPGDPNRNYARYPALPTFAPHLSPDFAVFLDDANRSSESMTIRQWENEYNFSFKVVGDIAIGGAKSGIKVYL